MRYLISIHPNPLWETFLSPRVRLNEVKGEAQATVMSIRTGTLLEAFESKYRALSIFP